MNPAFTHLGWVKFRAVDGVDLTLVEIVTRQFPLVVKPTDGIKASESDSGAGCGDRAGEPTRAKKLDERLGNATVCHIAATKPYFHSENSVRVNDMHCTNSAWRRAGVELVPKIDDEAYVGEG